MRGTTHRVLGFLLFILFSILVFPGPGSSYAEKFSAEALLLLLAFLVGSLFPDLDKLDSSLGRKVEFFALIFKHRGFFHSFFAPVLFGLLAWQASLLVLPANISLFLGIGFALGYLSHLALDMLTVKGLKPFLAGPKIRGSLKTGGLGERLLLVMFVLFSGLFLLAYILS